MIHPYLHSGDILRMETTSGPFVGRYLDLDDPNWLEIKWDWPYPPEVQREIERLEEQ